MAWGEVVSKDGVNITHSSDATPDQFKEASWVLKNQALHFDSPSENLISYRQYLNKWFVVKATNSLEEEKYLEDTVFKERNQMLVDFLANEGKWFKPQYDKMMKGMKLPSKSVIKGSISDELREIYESNRYYIIPSFFRLLLLHLRKQKREFSIAFRSHGPDLPSIIEEFNNFCDGNHPAFNGESGTHLVTFNGSK